MVRALLLFTAVAALACSDDAVTTDAAMDTGPPPGSDLPVEWTLNAEGIEVTITRAPYALVVRDGDGREVLGSIDARDGAYDTIAWTTGEVHWRPAPLTKGQQFFSTEFDPWRTRWTVVAAEEGDAELTLTLRGEGGYGEEALVVRHAVRASTLRVEARVEGAEPRAIGAAFASPMDEGFLGLGERYNKTDQRGVRVYSWAEEGGFGIGEGNRASPLNPEPNGEAMTYYPIPFFLSTKGYAFWLDTTWRSEFDFATGYDDAWRVWEIGPTLAYEVYVPKPEDDRPWPYHLIDLFTETVGRPMIPPAWTFGPRRRINRNDTQMGVSEIQAMRDLDLALTGVDDSVHFLPSGSHVGREEELRAWVERGHELGYKMNCYFNSLYDASPETPIADWVQQGVDAGHFIMAADGTPDEVELISGEFLTVYQLDFTSEAATQYFGETLDWAIELGYDGWMYDFGEYVQPASVASDGTIGEEHHNLYPVLYQRAGHEHLETTSIAGEWLFFARSGYTGSSQWTPQVWSGDPAASFEDSDGLPSMPRAGINLGISGAPHWGGDIGGFHCVADGASAANGELWTRWIQQGSMSSNMQDQDACVFNLEDAEKASIWTSPDAMNAWRIYARLHTRLLPYFMALAHEAHATGAPVMRHVFLEHPAREDLRAVDDVYYLGPSLLVAPVVRRHQRMKTVDLPAGRYLDWRDATVHEGLVTVPAPIDEMPLFLRDGHLIPLLDPTIDTLAEETHPEVVGPTDVADVYDVVGFVTRESGGASFTTADGGTLTVTFSADVEAPAIPEATSEAELASCASCYLLEALEGGVTRVRISDESGSVTAGGLTLADDLDRRIRWDLYLAD
jgi:alpha-glucosidase (family GH31 glycosyl hydrolase)